MTNMDTAKAAALQQWLIEERQRRRAAEAAFHQTSIESAGRSDALYLASYLVDTSGELADLVGLDGSTVRGLILRSGIRDADMEIYRAGFEALGSTMPERLYGRKLARKLIALARRGGSHAGPVAEAVALANYRLAGSQPG